MALPNTLEAPAWSRADVLAIQKELFSLGLYRLNLDGVFGAGTLVGLVEAFGGDGWRALSVAEVKRRLADAAPPSGTRGEHALRYGALCRDALLEVTVGIGYDEGGNHLALTPAFEAVLAANGFTVDPAASARAFEAAGRALPEQSYGRLFVRESALTHAPAAGAPRAVHAVVRLVTNEDGRAGAEAARAFREGLLRSDVTYYAGHARYGSGPDFDPNMTYELLDATGAREGDALTDYEALERLLADEGAPLGRNAWAQFLDRAAKGRVRVNGFNRGNVFLNPVNRHGGEFGARLMYWNLTRADGVGAALATGAAGALAAGADPLGYQLWVFDGCRTEDYLAGIRATPARAPRQVDVIVTRRLTYFLDKATTLDAFLRGLLAQHTAEQIVRAMDARNVTLREPGAVVSADGLADNPVIP
jgi:hypothetical protein